MNNKINNNLKIDYSTLKSYENIKRNFLSSVFWSTALVFKIFWVLLRVLKYDLKNFINYFNTRNKKKIIEEGISVSKISKNSVINIKNILKDDFNEYEINNKKNQINTFDNTIYRVNRKKLYDISKILLADDKFNETLELISKYRNISQKPKINFISLQIISHVDNYNQIRLKNEKKYPCEYMHKDSVIGQLKILLYLSDVGIENGPFCYNPYSHNDGVALFGNFVGAAVDNLNLYKRDFTNKQRFISLPKLFQIKGDFGSDIERNSNLSKILLKSERKILGNKGTFIFFDPLGVHRGGLVKKGRREILQISIST